LSRDLHKYREITNRRLLIGFFLLALGVGDGLIYLLYGSRAAMSGLLCFFTAMLPVGLVIGVLWVFQMVAERTRDC